MPLRGGYLAKRVFDWKLPLRSRIVFASFEVVHRLSSIFRNSEHIANSHGKIGCQHMVFASRSHVERLPQASRIGTTLALLQPIDLFPPKQIR